MSSLNKSICYVNAKKSMATNRTTVIREHRYGSSWVFPIYLM